MRLDPINLYDYEAMAKQRLPHNDWDTIDAGAMDMFTTRRNRSAFEELTLRPARPSGLAGSRVTQRINTFQGGENEIRPHQSVRLRGQGETGFAEAYHNLGRIYAERGEIDSAIACQKSALAGTHI